MFKNMTLVDLIMIVALCGICTIIGVTVGEYGVVQRVGSGKAIITTNQANRVTYSYREIK